MTDLILTAAICFAFGLYTLLVFVAGYYLSWLHRSKTTPSGQELKPIERRETPLVIDNYEPEPAFEPGDDL